MRQIEESRSTSTCPASSFVFIQHLRVVALNVYTLQSDSAQQRAAHALMSSTIVNPPMEPVPMFHFCFGVVQLHGEEKDEERMFVIRNESILHPARSSATTSRDAKLQLRRKFNVQRFK